jgi:hypothetical protein
VNIIVLDACRNNPWGSSSRLTVGLASITQIPHNTILFYATGSNDFSDDGEGRNGTLTKYLLATIGQPGLNEYDVFKKVSAAVQSESTSTVGHLQVPERYSNFSGDFCFTRCTEKVDRDELEKAKQEKSIDDARIAEINVQLANGQATNVSLKKELERLKKASAESAQKLLDLEKHSSNPAGDATTLTVPPAL